MNKGLMLVSSAIVLASTQIAFGQQWGDLAKLFSPGAQSAEQTRYGRQGRMTEAQMKAKRAEMISKREAAVSDWSKLEGILKKEGVSKDSTLYKRVHGALERNETRLKNIKSGKYMARGRYYRERGAKALAAKRAAMGRRGMRPMVAEGRGMRPSGARAAAPGKVEVKTPATPTKPAEKSMADKAREYFGGWFK